MSYFKTIRNTFLILALLVAPLGCPPSKVQPLPDPSSVNPAPSESLDKNPDAADDCTRAEQNLLRLQCKDSLGRLLGGGNKVGDSFSAICQNAIANHIDMNPACIAASQTCEGVNKCAR